MVHFIVIHEGLSSTENSQWARTSDREQEDMHVKSGQVKINLHNPYIGGL